MSDAWKASNDWKVRNDKEFVVEAIRRIMEYGEFTLASGIKSKYYIDMSLILCDSQLLQVVTSAVLEAIHQDLDTDNIQAIGGPVLGAVPIVSAVLATLDDYNLKSFFTRKDAKEHGKKDIIEGYLASNMKVVLIEDVVTTGNSVGRTIDAVREKGAEIVYCLTILDRQEGGTENLRAKGVELRSICTIQDVVQ